MSANAEFITLGKISGVFGVKGWVKVYSHTEPREGIVNYSPWYIKQRDGWMPIKVKNGKKQAKTVIAQLENINDRNQAETLIGLEIAVKPEQLPSLPEGEYYWADLENLQVNTIEGVEIGQVDYVFATGANDVLMVKKQDGTECLIPFIMDDVIKSVDLTTSLIIVDWDPDF